MRSRVVVYLSIPILVLGLLFSLFLLCETAMAADWGQAADQGIAGGYGFPETTASSMAVFGGNLYVGTASLTVGCEVWRYDGTTWTQVVGQGPPGITGTGPGFGDPNNAAAVSMAVYGSQLYVGTLNGSGCQVWSSLDGTTWTRMDAGALGPVNVGAPSMIAVGGLLYVGTNNGTSGCEVWSYNGTAWVPSILAGFGVGANNAIASSMAVLGGNLHVGTNNSATGCQVWRLVGAIWGNVDGGVMGAGNTVASSMTEIGGVLYVGTNNAAGCQVWSTAGVGGPPYADWAPIGAAGLGDANNVIADSMANFGGLLHVGTFNIASGYQVHSWSGAVWVRVDSGAAAPTNFSATSMAVLGTDLYVGTWDPAFGCEVWRSAGTGGPPYTDWAQVNINGFAPNNNMEARSMASYFGNLYVGTMSLNGCEVWRYDGSVWTQVNADGFGDIRNIEASSMAVMGDNLYVGTMNNVTGCEVWRYDGSAWSQVNADGFGDGNNVRAYSMAERLSQLYIGTENWTTGCEVWRTEEIGGPPYTDWTQVNTDGFGDGNNTNACSLAFTGSALQVGTENWTSGCEVWRTYKVGGPPYTDWTQVNTDGFGDGNNVMASSMYGAGTSLHVGTLNNVSGCEVWRTGFTGGPPYTDWAQANADGFGDGNNTEAPCMYAHMYDLYVGTLNATTGCEVWSTQRSGGPPYTDWVQANADGFGDANNTDASSMAEFFDNLYVGTVNGFSGCEVWGIAPAWYLAEGATAGGFETWVLVQNPGSSPVNVDFVLNTDTGEQRPTDLQNLGIPSNSRFSFNIGNYVNTFDVSTKVEAKDGNVICERAQYWTPQGMDYRVLGHDSIGVNSPMPLWYLAEGATEGGFETWVLVQNPGTSPVHVDFTLNTDIGEIKPTELQGIEIPAGSRVSFNIGNWVTTFDVSTRVAATDGNVICERAMYWTPPGSTQRVLGHDSIGVNSPDPVWYLAEGATEGGFETWVLIQNPHPDTKHVNFTFNTRAGEVKPPDLQGVDIPAGSRRSFNVGIWVETFDVSTKVECTDGDVICERAMYWTPEGMDTRVLGHDSIGVNSPAATWYMAEGATEGGFETWVLIQNPTANAVRVDFTLNTDTGEEKPADLQDLPIPAGSRVSFNIGNWVTTFNVSTKVTGRDGNIICERAMYWTPTGMIYRVLGHDSIGYSP